MYILEFFTCEIVGIFIVNIHSVWIQEGSGSFKEVERFSEFSSLRTYSYCDVGA